MNRWKLLGCSIAAASALFMLTLIAWVVSRVLS